MNNSAYQQLAKELMDLWQKQLADMVGDKQVLHQMMDFMDQAQRMQGNDKNSASNTKPSHAANADAGMLDELTFRLAMCEKRLAALEQKTAQPRAKPAAKRTKSSAARSRNNTRSKTTSK